MNTAHALVVKATEGRTTTGVEELRLLVSNMNSTREGAIDGFTAEELLQLGRMQLASAWDFYIDQWTPRQVQEALRGVVPQWNDKEEPVYLGPHKKEPRTHATRDDDVTRCGRPYSLLMIAPNPTCKTCRKQAQR